MSSCNSLPAVSRDPEAAHGTPVPAPALGARDGRLAQGTALQLPPGGALKQTPRQSTRSPRTIVLDAIDSSRNADSARRRGSC